MAGEFQTAMRDMVVVPAGEFIYGVGQDVVMLNGLNDELLDAKPAMKIYLPEFSIDRFPVTNADYAAYLTALSKMGKAITNVIPAGWSRQGEEWRGFNPRWPVTGLTWLDCRAYAQHYGLRLPTELEWEKAARGIDGRRYPWGNDSCLEKYGHFSSRKLPETDVEFRDVDSFPLGVSPNGCWDMLGNAEEWCGNEYQFDQWSSSKETEDRGSDWKSIRGCYYGWQYVHVAKRFHSLATSAWAFVGFRCAVDGPVRMAS